jgi:hypothetical protein
MLNGPPHENRNGARSNNNKRRRQRPARGALGRRHERIVLTEEGVPAATPDSTPVSPVVFVSDETRARYPWIPGRVIAGSVWRGPDHTRVRVDENGNAAPWKTVRRAG